MRHPFPDRWRPFVRPWRLLAAGASLAALAWAAPGLAGVVLGVLVLAVLLPCFEWVSGLRFPLRLHAGILGFSAVTLVAAEWADGYEMLPALDLVLHATSTTVLAVLGFGIAMTATGGARPVKAWWVLGVLAFGFAMMVGAMWEMLEFGLDQAFGLNTQEGAFDTMTDIVANTLGAAWGAWAAGRAASGRGVPPPSGLLIDALDANPVLFPRWKGASGGERGARGPLAR
ncbi:hypothetical protein [Jannaschia formosa]|uniref:hypothetical protein n=1 Tax=Jannaschia formosa TaxID=2259592 RepID=UPI000E1C313E|nr:hypothetical protein [Jannaschia formosa]TFL16304.1 hypothetical protein DR046_20645 [Jannaschia formosa]